MYNLHLYLHGKLQEFSKKTARLINRDFLKNDRHGTYYTLVSGPC